MKKNMMLIDRIIRVVLAITAGVLYLANIISGFSALVIGIIALILFFTGLIGYCPLYSFRSKHK